MKLDEDNPCPHCGTNETLSDRTENDFKTVIPADLQYDWKKDFEDDTNVYRPPTPQEIYSPPKENTPKKSIPVITPIPKRVSLDLPLNSVLQTVDHPRLDPASQKVYYQLSVEFQIILDKAPNYREGVFRWNLLLPDRLQTYGLTIDAWNRICRIGDSDSKIQEQLNQILKSLLG
jgi:hypothetical protein